jgi:xanthine dehydrogenase accessory factor
MSDDAMLQMLEAIEAALTGGGVLVVATVTDAGAHETLTVGAKMGVRGDDTALGGLGDGVVDAEVVRVARDQLSSFPRVTAQTLYVAPDGRVSTRRHRAGTSDAQVFMQLIEPPAGLVVVGGGHVGLSLATLGEFLGFSVTVLDDREEFATAERFPMADRVICGDIGDELDRMPLDRTSHVVLVSRGHMQDEIALRHVVVRDTAYVGMIGSRRRVSTVLGHLLEEEFPREALERVSTPIGLDVGAETPEEIALSIMAEILMLRRGGDGHRLALDRPRIRPLTPGEPDE